MIHIEYPYEKDPIICEEPTGSSLSCEGSSLALSMILYINYTKGGETQCNITTDHFNEITEMWYPLQQLNGTSVERVLFELTESGHYRIPIPTAANEKRMRVNVNFVGTPDATSNISVVVIPESKQILDM